MIRELFLEDLSLWSCVWQSMLLVVVGLVGSFLLRRRPARAFQVLFLAMIAAVVVPAMSVLVKHFELGAFVTEPEVLRPMSMDLYSEMPFEAPESITEPRVNTETHLDAVLAKGSSASIDIPWRVILLLGWMAASLALLGRLLIAFINGVRLIRRSQPDAREHIQQALDRARTRLGISRSLQIRASDEIHSPMIWCWSRTAVLLVPRALNNNVDWVGVICHELAHCIRRDHISGLVAELTTCILCWNPLSWLAKKRLIRLGEQACDDWVVAGGEPVENYARSLLNFKPQKQAAFVPAVVHSRKGVAARVRRILEDSCVNPRTGVIWALTVSILAVFIAIGIACAQTRPSKPETVNAEGQDKPVESLHKAATEGDIGQVKTLISAGADVNSKDANDVTALTMACANGHRELVELLIQKGADIKASGQPLHAAAWEGHKDIVELLLDSGADVDAFKGENRWTPLHNACSRGNVEVAEVLITNGADVNALSKYDSTPIYEAVWKNHWDAVKLLVNNGAEVNFVRENDYPLLHYAIWRKDTEMAKFLVNSGADYNLKDSDEWSSLRYAVDYANRELVDFLITKGAKLSEFHLAAWRGDLTVVGRFLDQGTNVNTKDSQFNWTPLQWATLTSQRDVAEFLIARGADVNLGGEWNDPPLHYAAVHGHKEIVELLLAKGADTNSKDNGGKTALHDAARAGHLDIAELLIASGADVDARYGDDETGLHLAAANGYEKVAGLLVTNGADVNAKDKNGRTPLIRAVEKNHPKVVELLAMNGVDVNAKDKYRRTALYIADKLGHAEIVDLLRKYGATESLHYAVGVGDIEKARELIAQHADVNQRDEDGQTPLHRAVLTGHVDVAELLLDKGANINANTQSDVTGYTLLQLAADKGQLDMVKLLVAKGADVNVKRQKEGHNDRTAKSYALGRNYKEIVEFLYAHGAYIPKIHLAAYRGDLETVRSLIEGGTEVDANDDDGTPLHYAAMAGHEAVARFLIDSDANVNARNRNGWTPLHFAAIGGSAEVARMLIAKGADVEVRSDNEQTPLLRAAAEGNKGVIEVLLDNGAGVNMADPTYGWTPLHYAAHYGHRNAVELLLDKKASIEARLTTGHTPLALAEQARHTEIVELLQKHGAKE